MSEVMLYLVSLYLLKLHVSLLITVTLADIRLSDILLFFGIKLTTPQPATMHLVPSWGSGITLANGKYFTVVVGFTSVSS